MHPLQYVFIALMLCVLAYLALNVVGWFLRRYIAVTSSAGRVGGEYTSLGDAQKGTLLPVKRNGETGENAVATVKTEGSDPFQFPDGFTMLARLVLAEKLGETDALKLAVKVTPGKSPRYTEARARLHAALERERPPTGPRFVAHDEQGQPMLDVNGNIVTTGRAEPLPQR